MHKSQRKLKKVTSVLVINVTKEEDTQLVVSTPKLSLGKQRGTVHLILAT